MSKLKEFKSKWHIDLFIAEIHRAYKTSLHFFIKLGLSTFSVL